MNDDLHDRLRAAGDDFRPDSERMWDRLATGMTGDGPVRARQVRAGRRVPHLAVATGVALALIVAIVFIGIDRVAGPVGGPERGGAPAAETSVPPPPARIDEFDLVEVVAELDDGGNDWWSQTDVILEVTEAIDELTVEVHVVLGPDVESSGSWVTAEHYFAPPEIAERDGYLVYRWTLIDDQVIQPGEYILAAQYHHRDGPRSYEGDHVVVEGAGPTGSGRIVAHVDH